MDKVKRIASTLLKLCFFIHIHICIFVINSKITSSVSDLVVVVQQDCQCMFYQKKYLFSKQQQSQNKGVIGFFLLLDDEFSQNK